MKALFLMLFISCTVGIIEAQDNTKAVILYMEGSVDITRNGVYLNYSDVDIGTVIEIYDMIKTGEDGYIELEVKTPVSPAVTLKIYEDTHFYFDTKQVHGNTKTSFQLLSGSMGLKVQKLYNDNHQPCV